MNCKKSILSAAIVASLSFAAQLHAQETQTTAQAEETETKFFPPLRLHGIGAENHAPGDDHGHRDEPACN